MKAYIRTGPLLQCLHATDADIKYGKYKESDYMTGYHQAIKDIITALENDKGLLTVTGYDAFAEYISSKRGEEE